jgi:hypothetical protein
MNISPLFLNEITQMIEIDTVLFIFLNLSSKGEPDLKRYRSWDDDENGPAF